MAGCRTGLFRSRRRLLSGATPFASLLRGDTATDLDAVHAATGPETVAKILFTSGSTSNPKGVVTTQRMMCVNQAQMLAAMPFLRERPHRILDWLPWNHVFGGSHNVNLMLANGGSFYIDGGKPTHAGVGGNHSQHRSTSRAPWRSTCPSASR